MAKEKKTPEEKAIAKRERSRARRLKRKAESLGITIEQLLEQKQSKKEKKMTLDEVLESA